MPKPTHFLATLALAIVSACSDGSNPADTKQDVEAADATVEAGNPPASAGTEAAVLERASALRQEGGDQAALGATGRPPVAPPAAPSPAPPSATKVVAIDGPPASFASCSACHDASPARSKRIGPPLYGIFGQRAASAQGYAFSEALQSSGLVWDGPTMDKWLANSQGLVPGTTMMFPGVKNPAARKEIIEYLKAQSR